MVDISIADKILRRKKDPEFQKQLESEQTHYEDAPNETSDTPESRADQEIETAIKESRLQKSSQARRKNMFKYGGLALAVLIVGWISYYLFAPFKGGMWFGTCRVFLEMNVQYPSTLQLSSVEQLAAEKFVRIWYTNTDAFGSYRMENIKCSFEDDPVTGFKLKEVSINRVTVDPAKIVAFNKILPVVFESGVDLTYPRPFRDALGNIDIQTYLFRKPIL